MAKTKIVAGIELGSSKIATVVAQVAESTQAGESTINIVGASASESKGIRKGQIVDIEEAVEAAITSVEAAERMAGYNINHAYVAIGGAHIHSQNSHGVVAVSDPEGEISASDIDRVIEAASAVSLPQSREVVHVLPKEFIVDGETGVRDAVGMSGVRLEVETHIVSAASAAVKNIRKAVNEVGVEIDDLVFTGLAAGEATLSDTEKELGCVLIDIGGGTTSIAAYSDSALTYSGVIPIGAKNVTNDLAIGLRTTLESAEKIKLSISSPKRKVKSEEESDQLNLEDLGILDIKKVSRKTLVEGIVRPRLNEIFTMVKMELDRAGISNKIPAGAIITGGGAETIGAVESAKRMLLLPVRIGIPSGVSGLIDDVVNPAFAVSLGLVLYGAKSGTLQVAEPFGKKFKLPSFGFAGKLIDAIKNLLP
jgi:cell division protein FtsA